MRFRAAYRFLLLPATCVCLCSVSARAQSPSRTGTCSPDVPSEEFREMIGKKVFPKIIIDDVTFDGPLSLPPETLDALRRELNSHELDGDPKWLDGIMEIPLRAAWQDNGYFKVDVSGRAIPRGGVANHQHFSVIFHVDEGLQYRLGEIQFRATHDLDFETKESASGISLRKRRQLEWNAVTSPDSPTLPIFPVDDLRRLVPLQEGDILSVEKVREGLTSMKKLYGSQGYIDFTATPFTDVDDEHQLVSLRIELDEQKQFRIGKIEVVGLGANTEKALIWRIKPGDIFNTDLFEAFFNDNQSLLPLGTSDQNSVVRRNTKDGIADIKIVFRPCPRQ